MERLFSHLCISLIGKIDKLIFRKPKVCQEIKNVMVYSPNIGGHRHIYAKKFIDFFRDQGFEVYFVFGGVQTSLKSRTFMPYNTRHIEFLKNDKHVHMINILEALAKTSDELNLILSLQKTYDPDLTLFVDGDILKRQLVKQILPWNPKLQGMNYAVFIHSEFFYSESPLPKSTQSFFHFFLFNYFNLLDGGFYSDENLVKKMDSEKYIHLPEVGNTRLEINTNCPRTSFYTNVEEEYRTFLKRHEDKDVILCFGDLEPRKGLDYLLQLVHDHDDLILVRVGRTKPEYRTDWQSIFNKEQLIREDRLFELDIYVEDQKLFDMLFQSTKYVLLPYKHFYRTSSVMIQALSYMKPVLVPDIGLLKSRVEDNKLGRTYKHLSYPSFHEEFLKLQQDYQVYIENIRRYIQKNFTIENFRDTCKKMIY